jgi:hypothetical protein
MNRSIRVGSHLIARREIRCPTPRPRRHSPGRSSDSAAHGDSGRTRSRWPGCCPARPSPPPLSAPKPPKSSTPTPPQPTSTSNRRSSTHSPPWPAPPHAFNSPLRAMGRDGDQADTWLARRPPQSQGGGCFSGFLLGRSCPAHRDSCDQPQGGRAGTFWVVWISWRPIRSITDLRSEPPASSQEACAWRRS